MADGANGGDHWGRSGSHRRRSISAKTNVVRILLLQAEIPFPVLTTAHFLPRVLPWGKIGRLMVGRIGQRESLVNRDHRAGLFQLGLDGISFILGDAFLDFAGNTFDGILGFLET